MKNIQFIIPLLPKKKKKAYYELSSSLPLTKKVRYFCNP